MNPIAVVVRRSARVRIAVLGLGMVLAVSVWGVSTAHADSAGSFQVSYSPSPADSVPQANPDSPKRLTTFTIQARDSNGRPIRDAVIDASLTAPHFGRLVGSDVPRIEGRLLLHTRFAAPDGRSVFRYVLPIRGRYQLDLRAAPAANVPASFAPFSQVTSFTLPERSGELLKLWLVLGGLFLFGAASGAVLARSHRARTARMRAGERRRPQTRASGLLPWAAGGAFVALVASLMGYFVVEQVRDSRVNDRIARYQGPGAGETATARSGPVTLQHRLSRSGQDGIGVQTLLRTTGSMTADTASLVGGSHFQLVAIDRENGRPVFEADVPSSGGSVVWDQDFWDGVHYDLLVTALPGPGGPQFDPITTKATIRVDSMSPPVLRKLIGLAILLGATILGIAAGVGATTLSGARRRRTRRVQASVLTPTSASP